MQCKGIHNSCEANLDVPYIQTWLSKDMQIHVLSYKKKGAMCSLNVVTFGAERETWGRLFQTEMVLGTKDD